MNLVLLKFVCIILVASTHCTVVKDTKVQPRNIDNKPPQQPVLKIDAFAKLEKDLPNFNLFKAYGHWTLRASSYRTNATHIVVSFKDNKVITTAYEDVEEIGSALLTHIDNSKLISGIGTHRGNPLNLRFIVLHQDDSIVAYVGVNQLNQRHLDVVTRSDVTVSEETLKGFIKNLLIKPNYKRLLRDLLPTVEYINNDIDIMQTLIPLNNDDILSVDYSLNVGNWTIKASTEKTLSFKDVNIAIQDGRIVSYTWNNNTLYGIVTACPIKNSHGMRITFFVKESEKVIIAKGYTLYADKTTLIKLAIFENETHKSLRVLSRDGAPFDRQHIKQVIEKHLLFNKNIDRLIGDIVPDLVFYD